MKQLVGKLVEVHVSETSVLIGTVMKSLNSSSKVAVLFPNKYKNVDNGLQFFELDNIISYFDETDQRWKIL